MDAEQSSSNINYMGYALKVELTGLANGMNTGRREGSRTVHTVLASAV